MVHLSGRHDSGLEPEVRYLITAPTSGWTKSAETSDRKSGRREGILPPPDPSFAHAHPMPPTPSAVPAVGHALTGVTLHSRSHLPLGCPAFRVSRFLAPGLRLLAGSGTGRCGWAGL
jgi:hypothetical protein